MKELLRLFLIFLKIGATSFGGNIALVAAVRKELCEKRKLLNDAQLLDYMTLANLLPGPLATNVISTCGFAIRGMPGAMVCLAGVLLPAFVLLCIFSELYIRYGQMPIVEKLFSGLLPGVAAVIASTAWSLAKKNVRTPFHIAVLIAAGAAVLLLKGFLTTLIVIVASGLLGYLFSKRNPEAKLDPAASPKALPFSWWPLLSLAFVAVTGLFIFLVHTATSPLKEVRLLGISFGSMSVTLFGGGYVFIPAMERVVVGVHHWVSTREFADAIAVSQVTPGPISISATFVGWKVAGFTGALVATIGIFLPPSLLMIVSEQFLSRFKTHPAVEAVFQGVRPAVIGMITASIWVVGSAVPLDWQAAVIFGVILTLAIWKNLDTAILIPAAGVLGFLLHLV
jgi:chromate transporter